MATATLAEKYGNTNLASWTLTTADHTGSDVVRPGQSDRTVHVFGTFGGATVVIEGSLDGVNFATLHDQGGVALSFTSAGIFAVSENIFAIRPRLSSVGSGANVTVNLLSRSTK